MTIDTTKITPEKLAEMNDSQNHCGTCDEDIAMMRVDVADGKYTYLFKNGEASALRYGEPWDRDVTGDKFVYCLASEVESLRQQLATAWAQAHRLALELECLLLDTKDSAVVSKWWGSGMEALSEYQKLQPGAAENADAWAAMRKAGI